MQLAAAHILAARFRLVRCQHEARDVGRFCRVGLDEREADPSVLSELSDEVASYKTTKGALQFGVDAPLPEAPVKKLVSTRMSEIPPP